MSKIDQTQGNLRNRFYVEDIEIELSRRPKPIRIMDRVSGRVYARCDDVLAAVRISTLLNCEEDYKIIEAEQKAGRL
jgi:hypothetical protein